MADAKPSQEELMLREAVKMLSYADIALATGFTVAEGGPDKILECGPKAQDATRVGLRAVEHASVMVLKVLGNMELDRRTKALSTLPLDQETKARLYTLPLGQESLLGNRLNEAAKLSFEHGRMRREMRWDFAS